MPLDVSRGRRAARTNAFFYDTCGAGFLCEQRVVASETVRSWTRYSYSADGRLLVRTDTVPGAQDLIQYQYDALGRVTGSGVRLRLGSAQCHQRGGRP